MLTVHDYERIRRAYYIEKKSIRQIGRELGHSYWTVRKALDASEPEPYQLSQPKVAPVLGPYKAQIEQLLGRECPAAAQTTLHQQEDLPSDSRRRLSRGRVHGALLCVAERKADDDGLPSICPWPLTLAWMLKRTGAKPHVQLDGEMMVVQLFVMRLCYSRKLFVMAFPTQRQEAFLLGTCTSLCPFRRRAAPHQL